MFNKEIGKKDIFDILKEVIFLWIIYSKYKKYYHKDQPLLKQHIAETIRAWLESGLKQELIEKIKDIILAHFTGSHPS